MKRFQTNAKRERGSLWGGLLLFSLLLCGVLLGTARLRSAQEKGRLLALQETIRRMSVHCYAVEGMYPPSLGYLEENYGLTVDHDRYLVDYTCFASNLMPDITVLERRAS